MKDKLHIELDVEKAIDEIAASLRNDEEVLEVFKRIWDKSPAKPRELDKAICKWAEELAREWDDFRGL